MASLESNNFKSQLIRSLQDAGYSDTEIEEFRKIFNSPSQAVRLFKIGAFNGVG